MSVVQLEDLVFTYPEAKKANFQTLITTKEEFRQTASTQVETVPSKGKLFKHQEYLKRLMRQYDNQLVVWRTGTGKTCGVTSVTEYYKNMAGALEDFRIANPGYYKRAYVLVAGKSLKREFKFQLLCKCTDGDYITDKILNSVKPRQRKTNITNSIKRYYTVTTYRKFGKSLQGLTEEQLIDIYSNSIFIIDEVHNLKEERGKEAEKFETMKAVLPPVEPEGEEARLQIKKTDSQITYEQLWRLFHTIKSRKVMLL